MRDLEPCTHVRRARPGPAPFAALIQLEFHDGLIEGVVACNTCGATCYLRLLDWGGRRTERRIFSVAGLPRGVAEAFGAQAGRRSCDPSRGEQEVQALLMRAGRPRALLAWDVASGQVLAAREIEDGAFVPSRPWREALPEPSDPRWFAELGVEKTPCSSS